ncbi:MAG: winged helix-turn-helix domain-containing protein, partial [Nitrosotalea sp.]
TRSKIRYAVSLSHGTLEHYLDYLLKNGLLSYDEKTLTYKTTSKGSEFLQLHRKTNELFS